MIDKIAALKMEKQRRLLRWIISVSMAALVGSPVTAQDPDPEPNFTHSAIQNVNGSGDSVVTRTYSDGQGRKLQTQTWINGTDSVLVSGQVYDPAGRPVKAARSFTYQNPTHAFMPGNIIDYANSRFAGSGDSAYTSTEYWNDPLARSKKVGSPGTNFTATAHPVKTWFFGITGTNNPSAYFTSDGFINKTLLTPAGYTTALETTIPDALETLAEATPELIKYYLTVTMDPNGVFSQEIKDAFDKTVRSWSLDDPVSAPIVSRLYYDVLGQVTAEKAPQTTGKEVDSTFYTYNTLGQLISKKTPDAGTTNYRYDLLGRMDTIQYANGDFIVFKFDKLGRQVSSSRLVSTELHDRIRNVYDFPENARLYLSNTNFPQDPNDLTTILSSLENTRGRLVATIAYDEDVHTQPPDEYLCKKVVDLFSYDDEGRIARKYKSIPNVPLQTIKFGYDLQGKILADTIETTDPPKQIITEYQYNNKGQLASVSRDGKEMIRLTYDNLGRTTKKTFVNGTAFTHDVLYAYNIRDWVTRIATDDSKFIETICYDELNGLPAVAGFEPQYNGNISRAEYRTDLVSSVNGDDIDLIYTYDDVNRLKGVVNNRSNPNKDEYDATFAYLSDGRILQKHEGQAQEDWGEYAYYPMTNRLMSIASSNRTGTLHDPNYIYDAKGNMVLDKSKKMMAFYDWRNLPYKFLVFTSVPDNTETYDRDYTALMLHYVNWEIETTVLMTYDASGNRVLKEVVENSISSSIPPSSVPNGLLLSDQVTGASMAVSTDGTIITAEPVRENNTTAPTGALKITSDDGSQMGLSDQGLYLAGNLVDENPGLNVDNFLTQYSTDPGYKMALDQTSGNMLASGTMEENLVSTGVAYVDDAAVYEKADGAAAYELAYVTHSDGVTRSDGKNEFYVKDHLGSTRAVMTENGTSDWLLQEAMAYLAYGAIKSLLELPPGSEQKARKKFTGKEHDEEGGISLDYFGKRYLDVEIGRWIGVDPAGQFSDAYRYCINPIGRFDSDGGVEGNVIIAARYGAGQEGRGGTTSLNINLNRMARDFQCESESVFGIKAWGFIADMLDYTDKIVTRGRVVDRSYSPEMTNFSVDHEISKGVSVGAEISESIGITIGTGGETSKGLQVTGATGFLGIILNLSLNYDKNNKFVGVSFSGGKSQGVYGSISKTETKNVYSKTIEDK